MDKEQLLKELSEKVRTGEITHADLAPPSAGAPVPVKKASWFSVTKLLYVIGSAIVIVGIGFFVGQIWGDIGAAGRIMVTLGLGLLLAGIGSMLLRQKPNDVIGAVFHLLGGVLIPGGTLVTLSELSVNMATLWPTTLAFAFIFAFYFSLNAYHKHPLLTFFTIAHGTVFFYLLIEAMLPGYFYEHAQIFAYVGMAVGVVYLLLAHSFRAGWNRHLVGSLYFFGSLGFFWSAFSQVYRSLPWQLIFFLLVFGGLYLSVYMKSRAILLVSTLFLIVHIAYITGKYFANSLGWPISLVILGFIIIGLGYASITINKRYIKRAE